MRLAIAAAVCAAAMACAEVHPRDADDGSQCPMSAADRADGCWCSESVRWCRMSSALTVGDDGVRMIMRWDDDGGVDVVDR